MTRNDSVRRATDVTKDSVRHAAEVAAPYVATARENAVLYGRQAGVYGRQAGVLARQQYDARLAARVDQARAQALAAVPPKATEAVETAARRTRDGAKAAADYTAPRAAAAVAQTRAVAGPAKDEVVVRGAAALQALRGQVTAADIDRLVRRRIRRQKAGRAMRGMLVMTLAGGAVFAAAKWWSKQANPDWLVEPSEPTEVSDRVERGTTLTVVDTLEETGSVNGSGPKVDRVDGSPDAGLDAEVEAKQAEADRKDDEDH
ncbi:hypothetical protein SAMN05216267_1005124 [Actinacidiphila rubida]|uniref:Uncharacterized protein n=2 Tax=Actinacidiphila rubida TaxID=310780 RepID=A0A1H8GIZ1_9ACTN|nr:DUF5324 family protein [Actinacidiphila rubida]SEN43972.1 hypothetical protein SAMN05216267_1005124 [Actinacidiphila rubida]